MPQPYQRFPLKDHRAWTCDSSVYGACHRSFALDSSGCHLDSRRPYGLFGKVHALSKEPKILKKEERGGLQGMKGEREKERETKTDRETE